jgi:hypothetical protein
MISLYFEQAPKSPCMLQSANNLNLTARQYGEVVLPDASTGQSPGTLASKLSRCKEGMAHFLPSLPSEALAKEDQVQSFVSITRVAVQV